MSTLSHPLDFQLLYDQTPCPVVVYQKVLNEDDFICCYCNPAAETINSTGGEEIIDQKIFEQISWSSEIDLVSVLLRVWRTGEPENHRFTNENSPHKQKLNNCNICKIATNHIVVLTDQIDSAFQTEAMVQRSESNLKSLFKVAPIGLGIVTHRTFTEVNQTFCDLVGYTQNELIGQNSIMIYPDKETYIKAGEEKYRQIKGLGIGSVETKLKRKNGTIVNVILSSTPLSSDHLNAGVMFTVQDITERIKSEQLISKAKEEWETTFDTMTDMITIHDRYKRIVRVNKAAADFIHKRPEETIGKDYCELFWDNQDDCDGCPMDKTISCAAEESRIIEHVQHGKVLSVSTAPIASNSNKQLYIHVARDVTEQKKQDQILAARFRLSQSPESDTIQFFLRQALQEAEQLTGSQVGVIYFVDQDHETLTLQAYSDPAFKEMCETLLKNSADSDSRVDIFVDCINQQKAIFYNDYNRTALPGDETGLNSKIFRKLAVPIYRSGVIVAIVGVGNKPTPYSETDAGAVEQLFELAWDIVVRKKAVEALKKSEEQLRTFIDASPDSICFKDGEGRWLKANSERIEMLQLKGINYKGKTDKELAEMVNSDYRGALLVCDIMDYYAWASKKEYRSIQTIKMSSGDEKIYDIIKKPLFGDHGERKGLIVIGRDVTEQKKLQKEANRSSRLAAIGELAAGVAHEINNPNALTLYNSEILEELFKDLLPLLEAVSPEKKNEILLGGLPFSDGVQEIRQLLPSINDSARRIKRIVDDLRDFARQDQSVPGEMVDINLVVQASLRLVHNTIKKSTDCLEVDLCGGIPLITAEKSRIEQVVINLLVNACQALENRSQKITVRTLLGGSGETVKVVVEDEGCGISSQHIDHIQDPFMTTKRETGGTGLGLSVSSRIVQEHGGTLAFESIEGEGTEVTMTLPSQREL